jgi:hypothetical protein
MIISETKINKRLLMHDLMIMDYNQEDAEDELNNLIEWFKSLPNTLELYRIIYVDSEKDINIKQLGSHYSVNKDELLSSHTYSSGYGDLKYLITVSVSKSLVDVQETLSNNILYPNELEVTLKNKGKGAKVISLTLLSEPINDTNPEDSIIFEQNTNNEVSKLLSKMVNEYGVYKAMEMTGLNVIQLFDRLGNNIIIDSEMANELLRMLWRQNLLPKKVNNFKLYYETFDGVLYWNLETDTEEAQAMCTPFWDGNKLIPIDFEYYTFKKDGQSDEYNPQWYKGIPYEDNFDSIQDLIDWFKEWYIPVVYFQLNKFLKKARKEYKND